MANRQNNEKVDLSFKYKHSLVEHVGPFMNVWIYWGVQLFQMLPCIYMAMHCFRKFQIK